MHRIFLALVVGWLLSNSLAAQTPKSPPATQGPGSSGADSGSLTDGLLDLLNDPAPASAGRKQTDTPDAIGARQSQSELSSNPLVAVQKSMLVAADFLSRGRASTETQELQSGIVSQLDELIARLEKESVDQQKNASQPQSALQRTSRTQSAQQPEPNQSQSSQSASEDASNQSQTAPAGQPGQSSSASQQASPTAGAGESDRTEAGEADPESQAKGNVPGNQGRSAKAVVDLADPRALQENVWGQLPDQVRQRLQSRMVERFLPSYREQIEAYFQALLENR